MKKISNMLTTKSKQFKDCEKSLTNFGKELKAFGTKKLSTEECNRFRDRYQRIRDKVNPVVINDVVEYEKLMKKLSKFEQAFGHFSFMKKSTSVVVTMSDNTDFEPRRSTRLRNRESSSRCMAEDDSEARYAEINAKIANIEKEIHEMSFFNQALDNTALIGQKIEELSDNIGEYDFSETQVTELKISLNKLSRNLVTKVQSMQLRIDQNNLQKEVFMLETQLKAFMASINPFISDEEMKNYEVQLETLRTTVQKYRFEKVILLFDQAVQEFRKTKELKMSYANPAMSIGPYIPENFATCSLKFENEKMQTANDRNQWKYADRCRTNRLSDSYRYQDSNYPGTNLTVLQHSPTSHSLNVRLEKVDINASYETPKHLINYDVPNRSQNYLAMTHSFPGVHHDYNFGYGYRTERRNESYVPTTQYQNHKDFNKNLVEQEVQPEIVNVHQHFGGFDLTSVDNLPIDEALDRLETYGQLLEAEVGRFNGDKFALEYLILDEKLMQVIEKLDKIRCHSEKKLQLLEFLKQLHNNLDARAKE